MGDNKEIIDDMQKHTGDYAVSLDELMRSQLGEKANKIVASFKKTILIKDYETEVIEVTNEIELEDELSGIERMLLCSMLEAKMEYAVYINLYNKGRISKTEYNNRKQGLEQELGIIKKKAEVLVGIDRVRKYFQGA